MFALPKKDEPDWQIVWHFPGRDEAQVSTAVYVMEENFSSGEYVDPGIILHVFANRLRLAEAALFDLEMRQVQAECQAYVNDFLAMKTPDELVGIHRFLGDSMARSGYLHLGYPDGDSISATTFHSVWDHFAKAANDKLTDAYPEICQILLDLLKTDLVEFSALLVDGQEPAKYQRLPVLQAMDVNSFAEKLLNLDNEAFRGAMDIFKARYEHPRKELEGEKEFRRNLCAASPPAKPLRTALIADKAIHPAPSFA